MFIIEVVYLNFILKKFLFFTRRFRFHVVVFIIAVFFFVHVDVVTKVKIFRLWRFVFFVAEDSVSHVKFFRSFFFCSLIILSFSLFFFFFLFLLLFLIFFLFRVGFSARIVLVFFRIFIFAIFFVLIFLLFFLFLLKTMEFKLDKKVFIKRV